MRSTIMLIAVVNALLFFSPAMAKTSQVFSKCYTSRGPTSVSPVPTMTSSTSVTIPVIRKTVFTSTTTVTPAPSTLTVTTVTLSTTTVTDSTVTDSYTSTSTETDTSTSTAPTATFMSTATTTSTSTASSGTTTLATPAGFLPVMDTLPSSSSNSKKKRHGVALDPRGVHSPAHSPPLRQVSLAGAAAAKNYPESVTCLTKTEIYSTTYIYTKTASIVQTTTAATPTSTITTTSTATTTLTVVPSDVSVTVTTTTTTTVVVNTTPSTTTTVTSTSTVTNTVPAQTNYNGACGADNVVGAYNGTGLGGVSYVAYSELNTDDNTAAGCCASCFMIGTCATTYFYSGAGYGKQCTIALIPSPHDCSYAGEYRGRVYTSSGEAPDQGVIVSNGFCGEYNSVVSLG